MLTKLKLTTFAVAILSFAGSASASNIVVNGSFEGGTYVGPNGDLVPNGWILGPPSSTSDSRLNVDNATDPSVGLGPEDGTNYARFESPAISGKDCLLQDLTTVAGMTYQVSFWVGFTSTSVGNNVTFSPIWDEQGGNYVEMTTSLDPPSNTGPTGYVEYIFNEVASGTTTRIDFHAVDTNGSVLLDNVVVSAVSSTPEPSTMVIAGSALLAAGLLRRRRKV